jgi:RNA polymerase sigma factor (sigma-70 family)
MSVRGQRDSRIERENLFVQAYPFARRSAQVHAAAVSRIDAVLLGRDDLIQEALLCLWQALRSYDPTKSSLKTYSERVVTRQVASHLRRCNAKKRTRHDEIEASNSSIELLVRIELRADINRALRELSPLDMHVARLMLHHRPIEVARMLACSRAAVYRSIGRIRAALEHFGLEKY